MKKLVIASLFVIGTVAVAASTVNAEVLGEQEQKQKVHQETETTCTGSYGQETNCHIKTTQTVEQEQRQRILAENTVARGEKFHTPVNTALDTKTAVAAMSLTMIGGLAMVAKRKIA